ncbi:MAG: IPT/TIG domain-containing protein [Bryobacteraceae bacterium]
MVSATGLTTVAPGGLIRISGTDLVKVASEVMSSFDGTVLPSAFNGTQVTIGGRNAPVLVVSGTNIVAQVPLDTPVGQQAVVIRNANGAAAASMSITVAALAPAIFTDGTNGAFLKNSDYSLVTSSNRVRVGDIVIVYSTGLGTTTQALTTGQIAPVGETFFNTSPATVTVGGREARVYYSIASPGFAGLYQAAFQIPEGAGTASVPVVLRVGTTASNTVNISLQ